MAPARTQRRSHLCHCEWARGRGVKFPLTGSTEYSPTESPTREALQRIPIADSAGLKKMLKTRFTKPTDGRTGIRLDATQEGTPNLFLHLEWLTGYGGVEND